MSTKLVEDVGDDDEDDPRARVLLQTRVCSECSRSQPPRQLPPQAHHDRCEENSLARGILSDTWIGWKYKLSCQHFIFLVIRFVNVRLLDYLSRSLNN